MLEIIPEGEISEHFKIRAVARGDADALNIRRTDAFLAGGHPFPGRSYLAGKIFLHRRHAGINQQKAVVVLRYQRKALQAQMPFRFKKRQIFFTQFVQTSPFHCNNSIPPVRQK